MKQKSNRLAEILSQDKPFRDTDIQDLVDIFYTNTKNTPYKMPLQIEIHDSSESASVTSSAIYESPKVIKPSVIDETDESIEFQIIKLRCYENGMLIPFED